MTPEEKKAFLDQIAPWAQAAMRQYGLPASVTMAQAILESNWGQSQLSREACNYFGIKTARSSDPYLELPTTEIIDGRAVKLLQRFRRFASAEECFDFRGRWLSTSKRYAPAMAVAANLNLFCDQLQACGYATDPDYAAKLKRVIVTQALLKYDVLAVNPPKEETST